MVVRKLISGTKEVERFIDDCSQAGVDVIELRWSTVRSSPPQIIGVEYPSISRKHSMQFAAKVEFDIKWIDGSVWFYPDVRNFCWGYLADTPNNRDWLAKMIKYRKFDIVDGRIKKEIDELAAEKGYDTEFVDPNSLSIKKYLDKKDSQGTLLTEIASLKAQLAEAKRLIAEETAKRATAEAVFKPLAGKRINKELLKNAD